MQVVYHLSSRSVVLTFSLDYISNHFLFIGVIGAHDTQQRNQGIRLLPSRHLRKILRGTPLRPRILQQPPYQALSSIPRSWHSTAKPNIFYPSKSFRQENVLRNQPRVPGYRWLCRDFIWCIWMESHCWIRHWRRGGSRRRRILEFIIWPFMSASRFRLSSVVSLPGMMTSRRGFTRMIHGGMEKVDCLLVRRWHACQRRGAWRTTSHCY